VCVTCGCQIVIKHHNYAIATDIHVSVEHVINKICSDEELNGRSRNSFATNKNTSLRQIVIGNLSLTDIIFAPICH
jgi:hypothetical protein